MLELASDLSPTVYSLDVGFSAVAEIYFDLWELALQDPGRQADAVRFKGLADKALRLLKGFGNIFPIGKPYLALYRGWWHWNMGKHGKAVRTWQEGPEAAWKYKVPTQMGNQGYSSLATRIAIC